ncbi:MAG: acyl-CoA thioesterase [Solirubrobacterales bacterium]|nr:acyl-CoA thioesterase [Solirubrobacterales bacterium]
MIEEPASVIRHPAETASILTYRTGVQDANPAGNVHGGWVMKLCDDAAVIAATRFARCRVVTATVDSLTFRSAVQVGDLLTLRATVNAAWRTSMEVGVQVESEHVPTGQITHVCTAYLTVVALDDDGRPTAVPQLVPISAEDKRRHDHANTRRKIRLAGAAELGSGRQ